MKKNALLAAARSTWDMAVRVFGFLIVLGVIRWVISVAVTSGISMMSFMAIASVAVVLVWFLISYRNESKRMNGKEKK